MLPSFPHPSRKYLQNLRFCDIFATTCEGNISLFFIYSIFLIFNYKILIWLRLLNIFYLYFRKGQTNSILRWTINDFCAWRQHNINVNERYRSILARTLIDCCASPQQNSNVNDGSRSITNRKYNFKSRTIFIYIKKNVHVYKIKIKFNLRQSRICIHISDFEVRLTDLKITRKTLPEVKFCPKILYYQKAKNGKS